MDSNEIPNEVTIKAMEEKELFTASSAEEMITDALGDSNWKNSCKEGNLPQLQETVTSLPVRPFDFIRRVDPDRLFNLIESEHPQTIALVLSYLEPRKASAILDSLPHDMQCEVACRIATMDKVIPEVLREVERVLEKNLSMFSVEDYCFSGGVESLVEILNMSGWASEKRIIDAIDNADPELAEEIRQRMFVFEDIVLLDDRSLLKVIREVNETELAKALKSVDLEIQDKIFNCLSKRSAKILREDMESMGPTLLKDIQEAQQKIISIIRRLEESGEIYISRADEDSIVV